MYSNTRYSKYFYAKEFNNVKPDLLLLDVLNQLRTKVECPVIITSSTRTIEQHISLYKKLEKENKLNGKKWHEAIPWGSRHLSQYNKDLRAVDFKVLKCKETNKFLTGEEIYVFLKEIEYSTKIYLGIGIGKFHCHVDIDRNKSTVWKYNY